MIILFRNLQDRSWRLTVEGINATDDMIKQWVEVNKATHSFHGVYKNREEAMEVSQKLDQASSIISHLCLNPDTQHLYDGDSIERDY